MSIEKHWASTQPAKQDEVRDFVLKGVEWALGRRKEVLAAAGAAAALGVVIGFFVYSRAANENEAWDKLSLAEAYSYYGRPKEAADALAAVAAQSASPAAASLAEIMQGDMKLAGGDSEAALAALGRAADAAPQPLKPFATIQKVLALEASGKPAECAAAAQSFLDSGADHFLAPEINEILARCQIAAGQPEAARATWQKVALQYPDTPWAARANLRLQPPTK